MFNRVSRGGGVKGLDLQFCHLVAPLPMINDQSLRNGVADWP